LGYVITLGTGGDSKSFSIARRRPLERHLVSGEKYHGLVNGRSGLGPALSRLGLRAASVPYGCAVWVRNLLYDRGGKRVYQAKVPVISVGNLTLGGTGKTPCVEYLARYFREQGRQVAILSRGYGGNGDGNDEARVLAENLPGVPHLQGANRVRLADCAVAEFASEVLILDDGFQHRRLARDLDLVLIDASNPWGRGYLFPRGLLREPAVELRRASVVMLTRCNQVEASERGRLREAITRLAPNAPIVETQHRPVELVDVQGKVVGLHRLSERPVLAFCGIGNPNAFRQTLADLGARVLFWRTFPDHHPYSGKDIEELKSWSEGHPEKYPMVTTQKDFVKIRHSNWGTQEVWALRISLQVESGVSELIKNLDKAVSGSKSDRRAA
jgi:tetraacyldisaccharide 4'-kinase